MLDNNKKQEEKIIQDLYQLDPELKKYEKELRKIIKSLLKIKPDTKLDFEFAHKLKQQLLTASGEKKTNLSFFLFNNRVLAPIGVAMAIIVILTSVYFWNFSSFSQLVKKEEPQKISFQIEQLDKIAFGDISLQVEKPQEFGVDGGGQLVQDILGLGGFDSEIDILPDEPRFVPNLINYDFVYVGEEIDTNLKDLTVFKRLKDGFLSQELIKNLGTLDLNLIDLEQFENQRIKNFNLVEDKEFGFSLDFNLDENSLSLNKNWSKWPNPAMECQGDSKCLEKFKIKPEDIPADQGLLKMANDFLTKFNVDTSYYDSGKIQAGWKKAYDLNREKEKFNFPDSISIIYPLKIEDKKVYQRNGSFLGLEVNIDIRHKKVAGINNYFLPRLQASDYPAISDQTDIISKAQQGGLQRTFNHSEPTQIIEVKLGTPSLELVQIINNSEKGSASEELYIPAFVFPIISTSEDSYLFQENVVVPAIKGFELSFQPNQPVQDQPTFIQLEKANR